MENKQIPHFESLLEYFSLILKIIFHSTSLIFVLPSNKLLPEFKEKIVLAITGFNNCAYSSLLHTRTAIENGVKISEVKRLLEGKLETFPRDEYIALLYSKHWTETKGGVSKVERKKVINFFGRRETRILEAVIMSAHFSNMCSNTVTAYNDQISEQRSFFIFLIASPFAYFIKKGAEKTK